MTLRSQDPRSSGLGSSPRCCARTSSTAGCPRWDTLIKGWVLDPDRKKMSKFRGNVVTPRVLIKEYGPDGIRYCACRAGPGTDTARIASSARRP